MQPRDTVHLRCPAKVNLALAVAPPDPATGLHPIASWMVAVDLCDELVIRRMPDESASTSAIRFADDAPRPERVDWPLDRDLAVRAHRACEAHAGRLLPVAIELTKRIPTGGGLGGGSSNAAGVLVALGRLFDSPIASRDLHAIAHRLGSDVPFALAALTGIPSAVVAGTGERIEPAPHPGGHLLLLIPPFGCNTAAVYGAFDAAAAGGCAAGVADLHTLAEGGGADPAALFNDLAGPARTVQPRLSRLLEHSARVLNRPVHVTGSGAVCFVLANDRGHAHALADAFRAASDPDLGEAVAVPVRYGTLRP